MSYLSRKIEKLASALYLVTSFFVDQEPLKWVLRSLVAGLVSKASILKDNFSPNRDRITLEVRNIVDEICSHLQVARDSGLISVANHEIVRREFESYLSSLELPFGIKEENGERLLAETFLGGDESGSDSRSKNLVSIKDKSMGGSQQEVKASGYMIDRSKGQGDFVVAETSKIGSDKPLKQFGAVSVKKKGRQSVIIGLLKRKKEIMIKDVSPLISGCSEKTIQRELLAMVQAGILKKIGEKRWSRYTLA